MKEKPGTPATAGIINLTISYNPESGAVNISGPLHNRMLCYGLLKMGEEIIMGQAIRGQEKQRQHIEVPKIIFPRDMQ